MAGKHEPRRRHAVVKTGTRNALLAALAILVSFPFSALGEKTDSAPRKGIKTYNELGNTGLKVSDVGFGGGALSDPAVVQYALDMGINYFDTAAAYGNGKSERAIGEVAAKHRSRMVICTKMGLDGAIKQDEILKRFEESLKRLQTTYVDILMIHGGNADAVGNPEVYAAFDRLKKEGKIKFTGVSHHGPNITADLRPLVDQRKVDVILLSYDPTDYPDLADFLRAAEKKGIGLVAMKASTGAKKVGPPEFKAGLFPFHQAALRWVLKDPNIDTVIPSINIMDQVDELVAASGVAKDSPAPNATGTPGPAKGANP